MYFCSWNHPHLMDYYCTHYQSAEWDEEKEQMSFTFMTQLSFNIYISISNYICVSNDMSLNVPETVSFQLNFL